MADPSNAGIIQVGEDRWIPGSRRADGTYRKERKIRPGFVPQEDVQRYSNARLESVKQPTPPPGSPSIPGAKKAAPATKPAVQQTPPAVDQTKEKRIKALNKKLRQIAGLEQKLIKGETLNEEQHDKVKKGKALRKELAQLESQ
ncbi:hypothetical protein BD560DRAFT_402001 [Blakeslea trispora]|nr:hypothetical protein BD560DRAFT_402001 [Blakeslea trispora]